MLLKLKNTCKAMVILSIFLNIIYFKLLCIFSNWSCGFIYDGFYKSDVKIIMFNDEWVRWINGWRLARNW